MLGAVTSSTFDSRTTQRALTILVIEDDPSIGSLVRTYLESDGFSVVLVTTGEQALVELASHKMQLVILDIGLPGIDGFEVCRLVRARSQVPIIILTARGEENDRVTGLELGADDYIPKPFSPRELVARTNAILRRSGQSDRLEVLRLGEVELHRAEHEVNVNGKEVKLTNKEFDLLAILIENAGLVLSRERLLDEVWGLTYPGDTRTVDVHVAQVRRKLGLHDLIETVRGAGYKAHRQ